ncbi:MAG TPA: phosphatase PAP2 family protein [Isosphaeraceae bacterium]|nr:phosphatase PAP2 family protein [Isosphaeraceae bacterium]
MRIRVPEIARAPLRVLAGADLLVLLAVLAALAGSWAFVELADEVAERETRRFDVWIVRSLRTPADAAVPIGPRWLAEDVRDLSALGSRSVLLLVTASVVLYLWLVRTYHAMWLVLGSAVGGQLLGSALKVLFSRPRPDVVPHLSTASFSSFPSGHSMSAAAVYLTLGLLLARLTDRPSLRAFYLGLAAFVTVLVGLTRLYLGVHYPTDVLAGWAAGSAWATACWLLAGYLQRRGAIEPQADDTTTASPPESGSIDAGPGGRPPSP